MMQEPERRVDHVTGARGDLGAATKTGKIVANVAVVLLDREGQVLAGEELLRRNQPVKAFPVVGQEDTALEADLVEKSAAGRIITPTQLPGQGSPCHRVEGPPEPNLVLRVSRPHRSPIWVGSGTADGMSGWRCGARGAGARSTSRTASCAASSATAAKRAG